MKFIAELKVVEFAGSLEFKELLVAHTIDPGVTLLLKGEELQRVFGVLGLGHGIKRISVAHVDCGINLSLSPVL